MWPIINLQIKKPLNKNKDAHNNEEYFLNPNFLTKRNIPKQPNKDNTKNINLIEKIGSNKIKII